MRRIFCSVLLISLFSMGCHKNAPVTPPMAKPAPAKATPMPVPKPIAAPSSLDLGERRLQIGKYAQAAKAFEDYLKENPKSTLRDRALFQLGLSKALASDSTRDLRSAESVLKQLVAEFPSSPYKYQAAFILGLQSQIDKLKTDIKDREEKIRKLSEELQKLKEIDLQRRPSRPQE